MVKTDGFTFVYNVSSLSYPYIESINSILSLVDKFHLLVVSSTDDTLKILQNVFKNEKKIIFHFEEVKNLKRSSLYKFYTNFALSYCANPWCFYIQADEVLPDESIPILKEAIKKVNEDRSIEGILLKYKHFYGSPEYYHEGKGWYNREIRIVRNGIGVNSWGDAQGFRIKGRKMNVFLSEAYMYHYGWLLPPKVMFRKIHRNMFLAGDIDKIPEEAENIKAEEVYLDTEGLRKFEQNHPKDLRNWLLSVNWKYNPDKKRMKLSLRRKIQGSIANISEILFNRRLLEYQNYKIVKKKN